MREAEERTGWSGEGCGRERRIADKTEEQRGDVRGRKRTATEELEDAGVGGGKGDAGGMRNQQRRAVAHDIKPFPVHSDRVATTEAASAGGRNTHNPPTPPPVAFVRDGLRFCVLSSCVLRSSPTRP